jgi:hypothetical protein
MGCWVKLPSLVHLTEQPEEKCGSWLQNLSVSNLIFDVGLFEEGSYCD